MATTLATTLAAATRAAARSMRCSASRSEEASTDEKSDGPRPRMRRSRLFRSADSSDALPAAAPEPAESARAAVPVSEELRKAFQPLGVKPVGKIKLGRDSLRGRKRAAEAADEPDSSSSSGGSRRGCSSSEQQHDGHDDAPWRDRSRRSSGGGGGGGFGGSSSQRARIVGQAVVSARPWESRGKAATQSQAGSEAQRRRWEAEAEERKRIEEEEERKRLICKARSETIPTKPKPKQDKVIFQAITREWDEKATLEELRGARAAARKVARIGLYDRNKSLRAIRRKAIRNPAVQTDEAAARLAASAARQVQEAAAKSIQPSKETLYEEAAGVKRSFARAEALPEGEWERLKDQCLTSQSSIQIGRKGATETLISAIQNAWRNKEVVKLVVHDDKSARKMNLPRFNLLLRELEERSGGVLVEASGKAMWLYRGVDFVPPPVPPPYNPPPPHELFTQEHSPRGSWRGIAGISCYVVSSSEAAGLTSPANSESSEASSSDETSSSSSSSSKPSSGSSSSDDAMAVLLLPDQFSMKDTPLLMQMADRVASKGALVIMPDLLGPKPSARKSSVATRGQAAAARGAGYWPVSHWPLVKARKLEYMDWYNAGPGSWLQQRSRLLQLLEKLQKQGLYDKDAAAAVNAAAAGAVPSSANSSGSGEDAPHSSSSSSSSSSSKPGRPLGVLGLGWGTYLGFRAAGDDECVAAGINAVAAMSPVTFMKDVDLATALQLPVALLPAKYDPMEQMMLTIDLLQPPYAKRCVYKRFGKVRPGWTSWLPQWIDIRAMEQAAEQLLTSVAYLKRELLGTESEWLPPPPTAEEKAAAAAAAAAAVAADAADAADAEQGSEGEQEGGEEQDSEEEAQE